MIAPHATLRGAFAVLLVLVLAGFAIGCAQTEVDVTRRTLTELPQPDRVLVRNFAVTQGEVELDGGIAPTLARDVQGEVESTEAQKVGRAAADALVKKGIPAERADRSMWVTPTTAVVRRHARGGRGRGHGGDGGGYGRRYHHRERGLHDQRRGGRATHRAGDR